MIRSVGSLNVKASRNVILAFSLGVACAMPAVAQTSTGSTTTGAARAPTTVSTTDRREDRDWGWIGLLGLIGLAGLMRKKDTHEDKRTFSTSPR